MTELELMDLLQSEGWTISKRPHGRTQVFCAERHQNGKGRTRYIATANTLKARTKEDVLAALARQTQPSYQHTKGSGRQKTASIKQAAATTIRLRQAGLGMQGIEASLSFEQVSKLYSDVQPFAD
jgi:hypothetical protein